MMLPLLRLLQRISIWTCAHEVNLVQMWLRSVGLSVFQERKEFGRLRCARRANFYGTRATLQTNIHPAS
eukprot:6478276-Amphidinium_carterae.1